MANRTQVVLHNLFQLKTSGLCPRSTTARQLPASAIYFAETYTGSHSIGQQFFHGPRTKVPITPYLLETYDATFKVGFR